MRLIDADALERHVYTEWANGELSNSEWVDFRQWLKDEPTVEPASPWHRVEDGFPCENTDALFYDENGYFHVGIMSRFRGYTEFIDYDGNTLRGVTHWMPLPEPPKEDA